MEESERAIELFVKDGNPREDWPLVDEAVRLPYRLAAEGNASALRELGLLKDEGPGRDA